MTSLEIGKSFKAKLPPPAIFSFFSFSAEAIPKFLSNRIAKRLADKLYFCFSPFRRTSGALVMDKAIGRELPSSWSFVFLPGINLQRVFAMRSAHQVACIVCVFFFDLDDSSNDTLAAIELASLRELVRHHSHGLFLLDCHGSPNHGPHWRVID
jgi:hypothetical protein